MARAHTMQPPTVGHLKAIRPPTTMTRPKPDEHVDAGEASGTSIHRKPGMPKIGLRSKRAYSPPPMAAKTGEDAGDARPGQRLAASCLASLHRGAELGELARRA